MENDLVESLESSDYYCTGSCFCESSSHSNRRITSILGTRSLGYFVTAVSTIFAIKKAKDLFLLDCKSEILDDECEENNIKSEVKSCEKKDKKKEKEYIEKEGFRRYLCKGNCLINGNLRTDYTIHKAEEFDCKKLEKRGYVEIEVGKVKKASNINRMALIAFTREYLKTFCREKSIDYYFYERPSGGSKKLTQFSKCVGGKKTHGNPSVHCIQTNPSPTNTNTPRKYWDEKS